MAGDKDRAAGLMATSFSNGSNGSSVAAASFLEKNSWLPSIFGKVFSVMVLRSMMPRSRNAGKGCTEAPNLLRATPCPELLHGVLKVDTCKNAPHLLSDAALKDPHTDPVVAMATVRHPQTKVVAMSKVERTVGGSMFEPA
eukprot:CAMPEP_0169139954 /NCGR_PEP_ID=MMETSP1015-20121227/43314_1 /TAXON_ID=342587 /ORGANISM="Karlodinium micrum, Strain CCMP2283" /LENGTH=140 /DNA_ID=CAMNT_0009205833 /DNA_START=403 /DNA_END=822 /DNA_ORIENTATION=-